MNLTWFVEKSSVTNVIQKPVKIIIVISLVEYVKLVNVLKATPTIIKMESVKMLGIQNVLINQIVKPINVQPKIIIFVNNVRLVLNK